MNGTLMETAFERTCTLVWIVLLVLTIFSGVLADTDSSPVGLSKNATAITLLAIAFFKVRLVIIHFMEIGHAAFPLRLVLETWLILSFIALLTLYFVELPITD